MKILIALVLCTMALYSITIKDLETATKIKLSSPDVAYVFRTIKVAKAKLETKYKVKIPEPDIAFTAGLDDGVLGSTTTRPNYRGLLFHYRLVLDAPKQYKKVVLHEYAHWAHLYMTGEANHNGRWKQLMWDLGVKKASPSSSDPVIRSVYNGYSYQDKGFIRCWSEVVEDYLYYSSQKQCQRGTILAPYNFKSNTYKYLD